MASNSAIGSGNRLAIEKGLSQVMVPGDLSFDSSSGIFSCHTGHSMLSK